VRARQLDRGGAVGRRRRPRHADRASGRRVHRQLGQDLPDRRAARGLAVCARRAVHPGHAVSPEGRRRPVGAAQAAQGAAGMNAPRSTSALLYLSVVTVSFDGFKALNNLSLLVEPGEMRAIIGPNGAGKTTMMDVITGKTRPDSGEVFFQEGTYDLSRLDETEIAGLGIGRKFQKPTVFDMHTVEDNLLLALKCDRRVRATLLWQRSAEQEARINALLERVNLGPLRSRVAAACRTG